MARIERKYPGRSAAELYARVDEVMEAVASELSLAYETDEAGRTGTVSRMGITGSYAVADATVTVELAYPILVPGALRRKVEERIAEKLDGLFS